jgi:hypothetical protein
MTRAHPSDRAATPSEEWRAVVGYEGRYEVSSLGRIRASDPILSQCSDGKGYLQAGLWNGERKTTHKVHSLVCRAFRGAPLPGQQVAHLDGNPLNNNADNLRWATAKENASHKALHGTRQTGARNGRCKFSEAQVERVRSLHRGGFSEVMIAERTGVSATQVHRIVSGEQRNG